MGGKKIEKKKPVIRCSRFSSGNLHPSSPASVGNPQTERKKKRSGKKREKKIGGKN